MSFKHYREESKKNWGTDDHRSLSIEQINCGAILRIADATEKMASNYTRMENDLKYYKEKFDQKNIEIKRLERVIAGLRGYLKRTKSKQK